MFTRNRLVFLGIAALLSWAGWATLSPAKSAKKPLSSLVLRTAIVPQAQLKYEFASNRMIKPCAEIRCEVKNQMAKTVDIHTASCSWYENWSTDNPKVKPVLWACASNAIVQEKLAPGATYTKILPITFEGAEAGQKVTFRITFVSDLARNPRQTVYRAQSEPITMRVP